MLHHFIAYNIFLGNEILSGMSIFIIFKKNGAVKKRSIIFCNVLRTFFKLDSRFLFHDFWRFHSIFSLSFCLRKIRRPPPFSSSHDILLRNSAILITTKKRHQNQKLDHKGNKNLWLMWAHHHFYSSFSSSWWTFFIIAKKQCSI